MSNILLVTLLLPLAGFLLLLVMPQDSHAASPVARFVTFFTAILSWGLIRPALSAPSTYTSGINIPWISSPNIHFHLGIDGISIWLVVLTTLLLIVAVWIADDLIPERKKSFYSLLLLFEFGLIGVFTAQDLFVFYVFWEVALIPMYLMVGGWGGPRRVHAAVKFFVYTFLGSVMMLAAIIYVATKAQTFDYQLILAGLNSGALHFTRTEELLLFLAFLLAFAIKIPVFPLHTWQPLTYEQAPAPATFLLAAGMSKMGTYGLVRFCMTLFPNAAHRCTNWIIALAITGIIYGALIAIVQPNIKRLIAYSSISHLGFIILGLFTFDLRGADGAVYQMVAHGISTGALFVMAGYLERRRGSMEIADFGGVAASAPCFSTVFLIATLASIGLPALCNFIGEFLVLQGAANTHFSWAVLAATGVILSAVYMLWMYQRTFLGKTHGVNAALTDLTPSEWAPLIILLVPLVWMGVYAQTFLPAISSANAEWISQSQARDEVTIKVRLIPPVLSPISAAEVTR
jgi:NADH-quinone oxidoreductase subunit M